MSIQEELGDNKQGKKSFWSDRGEREFILILGFCLLIIGLIIWFSFGQSGKQVVKTSYNQVAGIYQDISSGLGDNLNVQADENLVILPEHSRPSYIFLKHIKVGQIKPKELNPKDFSLDKIKSTIYNGVEQNQMQAVASGKPVFSKGKYLDVDLSSQTMTLYKDGVNRGNYLVSTGSAYHPTPVGTYRINSKSLNAYSAPYGLYMPYWMAFIGSSYGIHELPETVSGIKEGSSSLGVPVSHGCVRLGVGPAARVYSFAPIGTRVFIHQ